MPVVDYDTGEDMVDMTGKEVVEVRIAKDPSNDTYKLWVNVDGRCRLRAYRTKNVTLDIPTEMKKDWADDNLEDPFDGE